MRVNLQTIDRERFNVLSADGRHLIKPVKIMRDWHEGEEWLRSLEVDDQGNVLSAGFPKFFNFGERPADNDLLLKASEFRVRNKYDGTLIIATNGRCRTRGQLDLGQFEEAVREAGMPTGRPGVSELYELLGPVSRQVVDYGTKHRLVKLAEVDLATMTLALCVEPAVLTNNAADLIEQVRAAALDQGEGYVVDVDTGSGLHLVKIKSDAYRRAHALREHATEASTHRLLADAGATSRAQALEILAGLGYDFEMLTSCSVWVDNYLTRRYAVLTRFNHAIASVPTDSRKSTALWVKEHVSEMMGPIMAMLSGETARADQMLACLVLDVSFGSAPGVRIGLESY
jgi:hypothetical protein